MEVEVSEDCGRVKEYYERIIAVLKEAVRSFYYLYNYSPDCWEEVRRLNKELSELRVKYHRLERLTERLEELEELRRELALTKKKYRRAVNTIRRLQGALGAKKKKEMTTQKEEHMSSLNMEQITFMERIIEALLPNTFTQALDEHCLTNLAQKFLRGEDNKFLEYVSEDAVYETIRYKDKILSMKQREGCNPKPLFWII